MSFQTFTIASKAQLASYIATPNGSASRPAVIVLPGGGWIGTSPSEGECVALAYLAQGFQAFVLDYSTLRSNPEGCAYPQPLCAGTNKLVIRAYTNLHNRCVPDQPAHRFGLGGPVSLLVNMNRGWVPVHAANS